ncbi:MAG: GIY-YIG nuclease family protein [Candidatus Sungbacteria bacterium]|uniref:GIY-YIG nuclease family protein n=1 Tax=Candidatus Sungiibacteriota bacterium TaxID=2750080 RepID=A0A932YZ96_9BACT|nr:GIY-YIG nuclease family protein [Candidatus Sungbacteria bacterium]
MYYLYILKCADTTLYTGIARDLEKRIAEHNTDTLGAKYTRSRRPVKLAYSRRFKSRANAQKEEARIKALSRKEKLVLIKK